MYGRLRFIFIPLEIPIYHRKTKFLTGLILMGAIYLFSYGLSGCAFAQEAEAATLINYEPVKLDDPSQDGWKPLSEDERQKKIEELAFKAADATAELFDSLSIPYLAGGVNNLVGLGKQIKEYNKWLKRKYNCEFKLKRDSGFLIYSKSF